MKMSPFKKRLIKLLQVLVFICWLTLLVGTYSFAVMYSATPGKTPVVPGQWPENSQISLDDTKKTLVMVIHPKCSCSRASLNELKKILCHCPSKFRVYILMVVPSGLDKSWAETDLLMSAQSIEGATIVFDFAGKLAEAFGAETSGHTMVYFPSGKIAFEGGITPSRAHEGDNLGQTTIEELSRGEAKETQCQVFGCPLKGD